MNLDELKNEWNQRHTREAAMRIEDLSETVVAKGEDFERRIRRRDWIESAAAAVAVSVFVGFFFIADWPVAIKLSVGLIIVACVQVVATMWWTRKRDPLPDAKLPLLEYAEAELQRVNRQIRLLKSSAWWYAGPTMFSCAVFFWAVLSSVPLPAHIFYGFLSAFWGLHHACRVHCPSDQSRRGSRET